MSVVELKVVLEEVEPVVLRTLHVPIAIRLDKLHLVLQAAMGWENSHLYMFEVGSMRWGLPDPDFGDDYAAANKATLKSLMDDAANVAIHYIYDIGDHWQHLLEVGEARSPVPGKLYPRLADITGRCPPEDVGGSAGYEHFLSALADPEHLDHDDMKQWYGSIFDPRNPETDELKFEVLKLAKRWEPRKTPS